MPASKGSGINTEAKLLPMDHAISDLGVARADLKADARNMRSRRPIEVLGATFEEVLRGSEAHSRAGDSRRARYPAGGTGACVTVGGRVDGRRA